MYTYIISVVWCMSSVCFAHLDPAGLGAANWLPDPVGVQTWNEFSGPICLEQEWVVGMEFE